MTPQTLANNNNNFSDISLLNTNEYLLKEISSIEIINFQKTKDRFILFIGRPSCHFCLRVLPILREEIIEKDLEIYYYNTENYDDEFLKFAEKYKIFSIPRLMYFYGEELIDDLNSEKVLMTKDKISNFLKGIDK